MKPQQLLFLCAAPALAHEPGSHRHHLYPRRHHHDETLGQGDVCGISVFSTGNSEGKGGDSMCFENSGYWATSEDHHSSRPKALEASPMPQCFTVDAAAILGTNCTAASCPAHGQHHRHPRPWTGHGSCFTSAKSGDEFCVFHDAGFAHGRGTAIITTAARADYLASRPAFVDPETVRGRNKDPLGALGHARTEVRPIPGKGMGLVAAEDIERGDLIMAQTPSVMIDLRTFEDLPREQWLAAQMEAVDGLPRAHRELVMNLSTHDDRATLERGVDRAVLIDRLTTVNAFDIDPASDDDPEPRQGFYTLFPEIARLNHDCRPNANYYFNHATMTQFVHAVAPIRRGEEISISYVEPAVTRAERAQRLRAWGFECSCRQCGRTGVLAAASDARVRQINDLMRDLRRYGPDSRATPQVAELVVGLYEQERLWSTLYQAYALAALEHNGAGDWATATRYARLAVEHGVPAVGEADADVHVMMELAEDPVGALELDAAGEEGRLGREVMEERRDRHV